MPEGISDGFLAKTGGGPMNRTQRAVKKTCRQALADAKRQKRQRLYELRESRWDSKEKKSASLKDAVKHEKSLRGWHRKCVEDYAVKNSVKEEKTA